MKMTRVLLFVGGIVVIGLLIALAITQLLTQETPVIVDPKIEALHRLEQESQREAEFYFQNGFPRFALVQVPVEGENSVERARNFLEEYTDFYRQDDPRLALNVRRVGGENDEYVLFYQTYLGIEVFGSEILVMVNGENITATIGGLLPEGVVVDTYPLVDANQAVEISRQEYDLPEAMVVGEVTIMIYDPSISEEVPSEPHLVWRVPLGPGATQLVYVDAHDGTILLESNLAIDGFELDHEDANGYPDGNVDCYWNTTDDDWIGDEDGLLVSYHDEVDAVNSWWYSRWAYDFFKATFGRDSFDHGGGELELYVFSGAPNARWVGGTGCDLIEFREGWVGWDVMVHEYAHGIQFYTSQIGMHGGYGQQMSLRESFSDIQGIYADPNDWTVGEDRTGFSGIVRSISNPGIQHMDNINLSGTKGAGYDNSGIPSKAAHYLATGSFLSPGIGRTSMGNIYWHLMTFMPHNAQFIDARNMAVALAEQHYTPMVVCAVKNSWGLVGVGDGDAGCDGIPDPDLTDSDGDYKIDALDNCVNTYNPYQLDYDHDGVGDECDVDDDNDGIWDETDNCIHTPNTDQSDADNDGKGDLCDDEDGDFILDIYDNCPLVPNPNQIDSDEDGLGNACDDDLDGDGVNEYGRGGVPLDNCPFEPNPDQLDSDGDGIGDVCDGCPFDYDFMQAYTYVDPFLASLGVLPEPYQPDSDGDGIPDACDDDVRIDGRPLRAQGSEWAPDGRPHNLEVIGEPGGFLVLPIPACQPEEDWYPQNYRGRLAFDWVDENVGLWLGDSAGFGAGEAQMVGDEQVIEFQPRGGRNYFLLVGFSPDYPAGENTLLSLNFTCLEAAQEEEGSDEAFEPLHEEIPDPPAVPEPTDEEPEAEEITPEEENQPVPEEPFDRCALFDGQYRLTLMDLQPDTMDLRLYIFFPNGVPYLEFEIAEDPGPVEYVAVLGTVQSDPCTYQGYEGRLFCNLHNLPETYLDTVRPLSVYINGCDEPIFSHESVSILLPEEPEEPLVCSSELNEEDCVASGGTYVCGVDCACRCP